MGEKKTCRLDFRLASRYNKICKKDKCVYPGRVARHPSVQREQAIGWEPVCRPLCKVRPGSTLWENAVSQRGRPPLPALSDKPEWNRD